MYTKIILVSLVQVALARHILDGTFLRTDYNPGRRFRNPGPDVEVHSFDTYSHGNYRRGPYERYVQNNQAFQHGSDQANIEIQTHQRPEETINSQNANRRDRYIEGPDSQDVTNLENVPVNSNQRHHFRTNNQNNRAHVHKINPTRHDELNTLKTNLDTKSNVSESVPIQTTEYNTQETDTSYHQNDEEGVKTNEKSYNNSDESVLSQPAKTNLNVHSRFDETQSSNDSQPEVRSNDDSMVFIDNDNPKPIGPVKTTTDNELRYNTNDDVKEDRWVWDGSTTEATTIPPKTGGDLDDRTSFNGDACPKGQAKVLGQCVDKHN